VRYGDFEVLVRRLADEVPAGFMAGVAEIAVSPRVVPHPVHAGIFTLGECIPLPTGSGEGPEIQSRIVLYHGSFGAVAEDHPGFDWRAEAWETLTHELRHHLEFRAHVTALETYDWAADENFARQEGRSFDPAFYRSGERMARGVYKVDDDIFLEAHGSEFTWHGKRYRAPLDDIAPPAFLSLDGLIDEPHGEAVLVLSKRPSIRDLWRRAPVVQRTVVVQPLDG